MTAEGELIVMPPNFSATGRQYLYIGLQLGNWAELDDTGYANDSSPGYILPNGARRSPDISWTPKARVLALPLESREGYWRVCPAFVIELRSKSDRLSGLRARMQEYIDNGTELGWLIDSKSKTVEIFRPAIAPEIRSGISSIAREGPIKGFTLDLKKVWDPFA